jgi:hypothetical protein
MRVKGLVHYGLEVSSPKVGQGFYRAFGLQVGVGLACGEFLAPGDGAAVEVEGVSAPGNLVIRR